MSSRVYERLKGARRAPYISLIFLGDAYPEPLPFVCPSRYYLPAAGTDFFIDIPSN